MARAAEVVIKEIDSLLDELAESIESPLPAAVVCDAVRSMSKVRNRAEAAFTQLVGQLDASRAYSDEGARSLRSWMCWKLQLSRSSAAAVGSNARDLRTMPGTAEAFARGELTPAQVWLLRRARDAHPDAFAEAGEQFLLAKAAELWHDHFARVVKHWIYVNNPDEEEERPAAATTAVTFTRRRPSRTRSASMETSTSSAAPSSSLS